MLNTSKINLTSILLTVLVIIVLIQSQCGGEEQPKNTTTTIVKVETKWDTVKINTVEYVPYKNTVIKTHPHLINEVHPKKNNGVDISFYSKGNKSLKVWWICKFGHTWKTTICSRTSMKSGCSKCAYNNKSRNTAGIFNRT